MLDNSLITHSTTGTGYRPVQTLPDHDANADTNVAKLLIAYLIRKKKKNNVGKKKCFQFFLVVTFLPSFGESYLL